MYIPLVYERELSKNDYHKNTTNNNYKKPQKEKKVRILIVIVILELNANKRLRKEGFSKLSGNVASHP